MTSKNNFCVDCWWQDLHQVSENLRTLADDLAALCTKRPLRDGEPGWHGQLGDAIAAVVEAQRHVEDVFDRDGLRLTGEDGVSVPNDLN